MSLAALLVAVVGIAVSRTTITGAPAWYKPAKFGLSIAVYCATLGWMLSYVQGHALLVRVVAWATALCLVTELVLIDAQVLRGTTSHFNDATPFDAAVAITMGGLIAIVFLATAATEVLLVSQTGLPTWLRYGLGGGLLVCLLGMAEAVLMLTNTQPGRIGGHTVGAPDGGPGLPFLGWSTQHGDLRIAHFVGLHALQLIPLLAWVVHRCLPAGSEDRQRLLVLLATLAYIGLVALLTWQALRGQPLLRPDRTTLAALSTGIVATAASGTAVVHYLRT